MDALTQRYLETISPLDMLMTVLRDAHEDPICAEELEMVTDCMNRFQIELSAMSMKIRQGQEHLQNLQLLAQGLTQQNDSMRHMLGNLPSRLQKQPTNTRENRSTLEDITSSRATTNTKAAANTNHNAGTVQHNTVSGNQQAGMGGRQVNVYFPEIELLTIEEFEQIPKYQKGRLPYDQVNKTIEGMNLAYKAKYKVFKMKRSTMNDANRKKFEQYKQQETKETKGCYFIVDDDMKHEGGLKISATTRSIMTILRHCGRIREVRGGRLTRYVYVDSY